MAEYAVVLKIGNGKSIYDYLGEAYMHTFRSRFAAWWYSLNMALALWGLERVLPKWYSLEVTRKIFRTLAWTNRKPCNRINLLTIRINSA